MPRLTEVCKRIIKVNGKNILYNEFNPAVPRNCANIVANVIRRKRHTKIPKIITDGFEYEDIDQVVMKDLTDLTKFENWLKNEKIPWVFELNELKNAVRRFVYLKKENDDIEDDCYHAILYDRNDEFTDIGMIKDSKYLLPPTFNEFVNFNMPAECMFDSRLLTMYPYLSEGQLESLLMSNYSLIKFESFPPGYEYCYYFFESYEHFMRRDDWFEFNKMGPYDIMNKLGLKNKDVKFNLALVEKKSNVRQEVHILQSEMVWKAFILSRLYRIDLLLPPNFQKINQIPKIAAFLNDEEVYSTLKLLRPVSLDEARKIVRNKNLTLPLYTDPEQSNMLSEMEYKVMLKKKANAQIATMVESSTSKVNGYVKTFYLPVCNLLLKTNLARIGNTICSFVKCNMNLDYNNNQKEFCYLSFLSKYQKEITNNKTADLLTMAHFFDTMGVSLMLHLGGNDFFSFGTHRFVIFARLTEGHIQTTDLYRTGVRIPKQMISGTAKFNITSSYLYGLTNVKIVQQVKGLKQLQGSAEMINSLEEIEIQIKQVDMPILLEVTDNTPWFTKSTDCLDVTVSKKEFMDIYNALFDKQLKKIDTIDSRIFYTITSHIVDNSHGRTQICTSQSNNKSCTTFENLHLYKTLNQTSYLNGIYNRAISLAKLANETKNEKQAKELSTGNDGKTNQPSDKKQSRQTEQREDAKDLKQKDHNTDEDDNKNQVHIESETDEETETSSQSDSSDDTDDNSDEYSDDEGREDKFDFDVKVNVINKEEKENVTKTVVDDVNWLELEEYGKLKVVKNEDEGWVARQAGFKWTTFNKIQFEGIKNQGNTCYLNSAIQMLRYISFMEGHDVTYKKVLWSDIDEIIKTFNFPNQQENADVAMTILLENDCFEKYYWKAPIELKRNVECKKYDNVLAKIYHSGCVNGYKDQMYGHYYFQCKTPDGYIQINDDKVQNITEEEFNKNNGTIVLVRNDDKVLNVTFTDCLFNRSVYVRGEQYKLDSDFTTVWFRGITINVVPGEEECYEDKARRINKIVDIDIIQKYNVDIEFDMQKNTTSSYSKKKRIKYICNMSSLQRDIAKEKNCDIYKWFNRQFRATQKGLYKKDIPVYEYLCWYERLGTQEYSYILQKTNTDTYTILKKLSKNDVLQDVLLFETEMNLMRKLKKCTTVHEIIASLYQQGKLKDVVDSFDKLFEIYHGGDKQFVLDNTDEKENVNPKKYLPTRMKYKLYNDKWYTWENYATEEPDKKFVFIGSGERLYIPVLSENAMLTSTRGYLQANRCIVSERTVKDDGKHVNIHAINTYHKSVLLKMILRYCKDNQVDRIIDITSSGSDFNILGDILHVPVIKCYAGKNDHKEGVCHYNSIDYTANDLAIYSDCLYYKDLKKHFDANPAKCFVVGSYFTTDDGRYSEFEINDGGRCVHLDGESTTWKTTRDEMNNSIKNIKTFTCFSWPGIVMYVGEKNFEYNVDTSLYIPNNVVTHLYPAGICQELTAYGNSCQARSKMTPAESYVFLRELDKQQEISAKNLMQKNNMHLTGIFKLMNEYIDNETLLLEMQQKAMLKDLKSRYQLVLDELEKVFDFSNGSLLVTNTITCIRNIIKIFDEPTETDKYLAECARNTRCFRCFTHSKVLIDGKYINVIPNAQIMKHVMSRIEIEHFVKSIAGFRIVGGITDRVKFIFAHMLYYLEDQNYDIEGSIMDVFKKDLYLAKGSDWKNVNNYYFNKTSTELEQKKREVFKDEHKVDTAIEAFIDLIPGSKTAKDIMKKVIQKEHYPLYYKKIETKLKFVKIAGEVRTNIKAGETREEFKIRMLDYYTYVNEKYGIVCSEGEVLEKYIPLKIRDGVTYVFPLGNLNLPVEENMLKDWTTWDQWSMKQQSELITYLQANFVLDDIGYHISNYAGEKSALPNYDIIRGHKKLFNQMQHDAHLATSSPNDITASFRARFNSLVQPSDEILKEFDKFVDKQFKKWEFDLIKVISEQNKKLDDYISHLKSDKRIEAINTLKKISKGDEKIVHKFHMIMKDNEQVLSAEDKYDRVIMAPESKKKLLVGFYSFLLEEALIKVIDNFAIGITGKDIEKRFKPYMNSQYAIFSLDGKSFDGHQHVELLRIVDNRFADMLLNVEVPQWFREHHDLLKNEKHNAFVGNLLSRHFYGNNAMQDIVSFIGKTPSGHAFHTTNMNTMRSILYQMFIADKMQIDAIPFAAGDDTVVFVKKEDIEQYKIGLSYVYCFEKGRKGGLGQFLKELIERDVPEFCSMRFTEYGVLKSLKNAMFRNVTWSEVSGLEIRQARAKAIIDWHYSEELEVAFKRYYDVEDIDLDTVDIQDLHYTKVCNGRQDIPVIAFDEVELLQLILISSFDHDVFDENCLITTRANLLKDMYSNEMFLFSNMSADDYQAHFVRSWKKQQEYDEFIIRQLLEEKYLL